MKKSIVRYFIGIMLLGISFSCTSNQVIAQEKPDTQSPKTNLETKRFEVQLPKLTDEKDTKVEFFVGKIMPIDCNSHHLIGEIKTKENGTQAYYEFETKGDVISTLMGCIDYPLKDEFVYAKSIVLDYNSRLPILFKIPDGFQIKYKVLTASAFQDAEEYDARKHR